MNRAWLLSGLLGTVAACAATAGPGDSSAGGSGGGTTTSHAGGSGGATGGGGAAPKIPYCTTPCSSPNDCASPSLPPYDAGHYACNQGLCEYLGCKSDAECMYYGPNYICIQNPDRDVPWCEQSCSTPAQCAIPGDDPYWDEDNWACVNGACELLGCNNDAECNWMKPDPYVCRQLPGSPHPFCEKVCSVPADCVNPAFGAPYDVDNFECTDGICRYIGCHSDEECKSGAGAKPTDVCFTPP